MNEYELEWINNESDYQRPSCKAEKERVNVMEKYDRGNFVIKQDEKCCLLPHDFHTSKMSRNS
jgi:hypothetical protein